MVATKLYWNWNRNDFKKWNLASMFTIYMCAIFSTCYLVLFISGVNIKQHLTVLPTLPLDFLACLEGLCWTHILGLWTVNTGAPQQNVKVPWDEHQTEIKCKRTRLTMMTLLKNWNRNWTEMIEKLKRPPMDVPSSVRHSTHSNTASTSWHSVWHYTETVTEMIPNFLYSNWNCIDLKYWNISGL